MKKLLCAPLFALLSSAASAATIESQDQLLGIWAMTPLKNGIANVVEFKADGKSDLHPFNCAAPSEQEVEVSDYRLSEDGQTIHITSPYQSFDLQVQKFNAKTMELSMEIEGYTLTFSYLKGNKIEPLCALYR